MWWRRQTTFEQTHTHTRKSLFGQTILATTKSIWETFCFCDRSVDTGLNLITRN